MSNERFKDRSAPFCQPGRFLEDRCVVSCGRFGLVSCPHLQEKKICYATQCTPLSFDADCTTTISWGSIDHKRRRLEDNEIMATPKSEKDPGYGKEVPFKALNFSG